MKPSRIFLSPPHMGGIELSFVKEAFDENWISPAGPHILKFENELGSYLNNSYVAALSSGTAAIHLALLALGIDQGDEVICSSFTFSGTCNPILYQRAVPIFIDSELETWNMDPEILRMSIEDRHRKGKKPKAIIVVHLYGMPAKMDEINAIASEFGIPVIEDAAEALGSKYKNQNCGALGTLGILSFNGNKIITTSGGGALVSSDLKVIEKARFRATQARDPFPFYHHTEVGYNYRLSNISAGIGRGQLIVLEERVNQRKDVFKWYQKNLPSTIIEFQPELEGNSSNRWLTCGVFKEQDLKFPERVRQHLEDHNIESRPLWKPMHLQPVFSSYPFYGSGISDYLFNYGLCLPSGSSMTNEDLERVKDAIFGIC